MKTCTAINIQYPISQLILSGEKVIETRTYPIPKQYVGKELAIVETPGPDGKFKARIVGTIVFSGCFLYSDKNTFYKDIKKHCVSEDSPWRWDDEKPKWGWKIKALMRLERPVPAPKRRGIVYTKDIKISM